jgi:glycosyltransferase involved in cell wall biosynthesis
MLYREEVLAGQPSDSRIPEPDAMGVEIKEKVVLHVGPDVSAKGGIAAVLAGYEKSKGLFKRKGYELRFLSTSGSSHLCGLSRFAATWVSLLISCVLGKVDLVHLHTSIRGSLLRKGMLVVVCLLTRTNYILHIHSGKFDKYYDGLPSLIKILVSWFFKKSRNVICLSVTMKNELLSRGIVVKERCEIIFNGIEDPLSEIQPRREQQLPIRISFLGKLIDAKGIFVLLDALKEVSLNGFKFRLVVAGNGDENYFLKQVKACGLESYVEFVGWLGNQNKKDLLAKTDIFVLPSRSEGFSVAIVEAMAFGIAIASTEIPGVVDAIQSGVHGILVPPDDSRALSKALEILISDEDFRFQIGQAARMRFIREFKIEEVVENLIAMYQIAICIR